MYSIVAMVLKTVIADIETVRYVVEIKKIGSEKSYGGLRMGDNIS